MFDNFMKFFKKFSKEEKKDSKTAAKERLHLVLMQDRANVSADFMELMKQEIIEVIKKYIDVDENAIDVKLTNKVNSDGTTGAPILYANIPIVSVKDDTKQINVERKQNKEEDPKKDKEEKETKELEKKETEIKKETVVEKDTPKQENEQKKEKEDTKNNEEKKTDKIEKDKSSVKTEATQKGKKQTRRKVNSKK